MDVGQSERWFQRPGIWFWAAMAIGAALRLYLVVWTEGTRDVALWVEHADNVRHLGLIGYYQNDPGANHPPFISYAEAILLGISQKTGIPYRILLRGPTALFDAGTTFLLVLVFGAIRFRWLLAAAYWLNPLAIIFSAYLDARAVGSSVFGYHGEPIHISGYVSAWGPKVLLFSFIAPPEKWPVSFHAPILFFINHSGQLAVLLGLLLVWLRRRQASVPEACATIGMLYVVIYGFSDNWAFQYFAWSIPFWFFLQPWFWTIATALATGYIYSLYWLLCGNPLLLGKWDFISNPYWPGYVLFFRNFIVLLFFVSACFFLVASLYKRRTAGETPGGS